MIGLFWILPFLVQDFTPPRQDFLLTPYGNYCEAASPCYPHGPYGAWIGNAVCVPEVKTDFVGVPRPNRAPDTLFPGDTGCDIGAFQFTAGTQPQPTPATPRNLRLTQ
jgi:hypothetical protein